MLKRLVAIALICFSLTLQGCVTGSGGLKAYIDSIDGYEFLYPNGWLPMQVASGGPDIVLRDLIEESENISVVVSEVTSGKQLADLGSPGEVGQALIERALAPTGSDRSVELVAATAREDNAKTYYNLEYLVTLPFGQRHNLASVVVSRDKLFTLNASAPEERWEKVRSQFAKVANSFSVY